MQGPTIQSRKRYQYQGRDILLLQSTWGGAAVRSVEDLFRNSIGGYMFAKPESGTAAKAAVRRKNNF
ncbi:hypothetical protein NNRS527_01066 [Nitrosospira sp. NRS527]|nr:hypothetical protein NNRS527_01066 [Nitrosospira sp. NRS527]